MKIKLTIWFSALLFAASISIKAVPLVDWTFEANRWTGSAASLVAPEINITGNSATFGAYHVGTTYYSTPVGNGSSTSMSSTNWQVGDYYYFTITV